MKVEGAESTVVSSPFGIDLGIAPASPEVTPVETVEPVAAVVETEDDDDEEIEFTPPTPTETSTDDEGSGESDEPLHEGRTVTSLLAEVYKQKGTLPDDFEIGDDMTADQLVEALEEAVTGRKSQEIEDNYRERGYDENLLEYSKFIAQGGNPQALQAHVAYEQLSNIPLDDEDNQSYVVRAMMQDQGVDSDSIDELIESLSLSGKLEDKSEKAKAYFGKRKDAYFKQLQDTQAAEIEQQRQYVEQQTEQYRGLIRKGEIAGTKLAPQEIKKLERDFLEATEVVTITNPDGTKAKQRLTKFQKVMNEISSNPPKLLELAAFILGGLEPIKQKIKQDTKNEVLDILNAKQTIKVQNAPAPRKVNGPLIDPSHAKSEVFRM